jgi:hypothetical protein
MFVENETSLRWVARRCREAKENKGRYFDRKDIERQQQQATQSTKDEREEWAFSMHDVAW